MNTNFSIFLILIIGCSLYSQNIDSTVYKSQWNLGDSAKYVVNKFEKTCINDTCLTRIEDTMTVFIHVIDSTETDYTLAHFSPDGKDGKFTLYEYLIRSNSINIFTDKYGVYGWMDNIEDLYCAALENNDKNLQNKKVKKANAKNLKKQFDLGVLEEKISGDVSFFFEPYGLDLANFDTTAYHDTSVVALGIKWLGNGTLFTSKLDSGVAVKNQTLYSPDLTDSDTKAIIVNMIRNAGYIESEEELIELYLSDLKGNDFELKFEQNWIVHENDNWISRANQKRQLLISDGEQNYIQTVIIDYYRDK